MTEYRVVTRRPTVLGACDIFLGPAVIALALIFSLLIPVPARAQLAGAAQADFNYQRTMSRIVAGSASGLQMSSNSTMDILSGGRRVGSIALKEKRLMSLATLAGRAVTLPGMIALGATVLLQYGLEKCADGSWCMPAQGEQAPNGKPWPATEGYWYGIGANTPLSQPEAYCFSALAALNVTAPFSRAIPSGNTLFCYVKRTDGSEYNGASGNKGSSCPSAAPNVNGYCTPAGYVPGTQPTPATATQVNTAWQNAMKANPYLQEKTWGFEDQIQQNEDWAKALAQIAELTGAGTVTDVQPQTSYTDAAGKVTKKQTTCTYTATPNSNTSTAGEAPLNVGQRCTTTTTNPDGTTTTETTETAPASAGAKTPEKLDIDTCGLPGKPACKIDETGTKTEDDVAQAQKTATSALDQMKTDNSSILDTRMSEIDQKARDASVHWISLFNKLPTYGSEVCTPPTIHDTASNQDVTFDICPHYYMAKDVFSVFIALGFLVSLAFDVRDAIKT